MQDRDRLPIRLRDLVWQTRTSLRHQAWYGSWCSGCFSLKQYCISWPDEAFHVASTSDSRGFPHSFSSWRLQCQQQNSGDSQEEGRDYKLMQRGSRGRRNHWQRGSAQIVPSARWQSFPPYWKSAIHPIFHSANQRNSVQTTSRSKDTGSKARSDVSAIGNDADHLLARTQPFEDPRRREFIEGKRSGTGNMTCCEFIL